MTKGQKFVRFEDWRSESSTSLEKNDSFTGGFFKRKVKSSFSPKSYGINKKLADRIKVLDPQGPWLQKWNMIFLITCVMAISVDPLFFYVPVINDKEKCISLHEKSKITACVLRTLFDLFYILRIRFQFRTGFIAPSSRLFGGSELIDDAGAIVKRYLSSDFIIDILSIIPLPQMIVLACSNPFEAKNLLKYTIMAQYVPRLLRLYLLFKEVTSTSGILTVKPWAAAAYNLFLYMLASHVVGAFWYLFSVESEVRCWHRLLKHNNISDGLSLSCGKNSTKEVLSLLNSPTSCPFTDPGNITDPTVFNFGIFLQALQFRMVESTTDLTHKFFFCFWWGFRNLSSLGQNLTCSAYVGEIIFAFFIAIFGLVLFSSLIGNMQKYLQSITLRFEEMTQMRIQRRNAERWMSNRMLPDYLKARIRRYEQYKWRENRGVEEEALIGNLPKDLRRDVRRHLCLKFLKRVPMFENTNELFLDEMCDRLKPVLYTERSYIVREGDPIDEMLFILRGNLASSTINGGRTGFFNSSLLKAGDFCGEELLTWAFDPRSSSNLPTSTRTVETMSEVAAYALKADDLKFVAYQFRRMINSPQFRHTFRFYSQQWRTWAACFIQTAWRRHLKKKLKRELREAEDRLNSGLSQDGYGSSPSFAATVYEQRFASKASRSRRSGELIKVPQTQRSLTLLPQKPADEPELTRHHSAELEQYLFQNDIL